ncbi:hypothetical protein L6164_031501 [Bauhinia variegata]|uniref:Uncharacterized protein n=1 Tax=Bauhinia variegata TaxID=167791 RepID=A0ACB9LG24_BAUVA|nr:hypothetical protein L6164_031501 [Bauhinia variegata]
MLLQERSDEITSTGDTLSQSLGRTSNKYWETASQHDSNRRKNAAETLALWYRTTKGRRGRDWEEMAAEVAVKTLVIIIIGSGLQELLTRLNESEISPGEYDPARLADLFQQYASKTIELPLTKPGSNINRNSSSAGSYACCILPAVILATLAYLYMPRKDWCFDHVMYVTRRNFNIAVETLLKQLENVIASLASVKEILSEKLGGLDLKLDQLMELTQKTYHCLADVKSKLFRIGNEVEHIHRQVSETIERVKRMESKQDMTNEGIDYLKGFCDAGYHKSEPQKYNPYKGLRFIAKSGAAVKNSVMNRTALLRSGILVLGTETLIMPKNKGKGGKNRKRGKNEADDEKRELVFKEDGQEYAQVLRMLGNGRCEATCIDGTKRLCHIRGKMHKKVWIAAGDIILVGLRDYQDDKADVILKYMADEARLLKAYGELPDSIRLNEGIAGGLEDEEEGGGDDYIEFEDEDIDKI